MKTSIEKPSKDFLIKINDVHKRVKLEEVFCLQSEGKYVSLILENRRYSFRGTLKQLEQVLPSNFVRTHSSFIVNLDKISTIKNQENLITLTNDFELSYSRKYKDSLFENFLLG